MEYITVSQAAERWGISTQRIRILLKGDRIPGAIKPGHDWLIPEGTAKPEDGRRKQASE